MWMCFQDKKSNWLEKREENLKEYKGVPIRVSPYSFIVSIERTSMSLFTAFNVWSRVNDLSVCLSFSFRSLS